MYVKYSVLLRKTEGQDYIHQDHVVIDTSTGYFGDKEYNQKVVNAIYTRHPGCKIIEFEQEEQQ